MTTSSQPRSRHPYFMHDMIQGQTDSIARILNEETSSASRLAAMIVDSARLHIVGIGTSWHAALVGEFMFRRISGRDDARAWNSFEFCIYPPKLGPDDVVIVMSHRGTKQYSARALELARQSGARTAVLTGIGSEARADLADVVVRTSETDRSSAFTISHTGAMTALALVATETGQQSGVEGADGAKAQLSQLPALVTAALGTSTQLRSLASGTKDSIRHYFTGWGPNASTAYEVSLKIKEAAYLTTEGFQLEQYLHGPFVATDEASSVTFIAHSDTDGGRTAELIKTVKETGASTAVVMMHDAVSVSGLADVTVTLPDTHEALSPIVCLIPLQLLTYWLAVETGRNPDTFRLDDPKHSAARQHYQL